MSKPSVSRMDKVRDTFKRTQTGYSVKDMSKVWVAARHFYDGERGVASAKEGLYVDSLNDDALAFHSFEACQSFCERMNNRMYGPKVVLYPLNLADDCRRDKVRFAASQEFFDARPRPS